jgi:hypothetical protein
MMGVSYPFSVRDMMLQGRTISIQRLLNVKYSNVTFKRDENIFRSDEMKAVGHVAAEISPFEKFTKKEKSVIELSFVDARGEASAGFDLEWLPKCIQNLKLENIGAMYLMGLIRKLVKGSDGLVGGRSNELLQSHLRMRNGYQVVIVMSLKAVSAEKGMKGLLETHEPVRKNLVIGLAKTKDDDKITDLICLYHGMSIIYC